MAKFGARTAEPLRIRRGELAVLGAVPLDPDVLMHAGGLQRHSGRLFAALCLAKGLSYQKRIQADSGLASVNHGRNRGVRGACLSAGTPATARAAPGHGHTGTPP